MKGIAPADNSGECKYPTKIGFSKKLSPIYEIVS